MKKYRGPFFAILFLLSFPIIITKAQSFKVIQTEKIISDAQKGFMAPAWSPDGSKIAFTSQKYVGIWILYLQDNSIKQITDETAAGFHLQWSNDSKTILTRVARYENMYRYNAVKTFDVASGKANLLTDYRAMMPGLPEFTPGNDKVFLYGINKLEMFNSGLQPVLNKKLNVSNMIVYADENKIAVQDLSNNQLYSFEPVKGKRILNLQLSPDGSKAAFEIYGGDMYVININGTGLTNLGVGYRPKWSPDSQYIVYMLTKDDGEAIVSSDIYYIKIDGTEKTNLTNTNDTIEMNPDWSPDGKKIAFDLTNENAIYTIEIAK